MISIPDLVLAQLDMHVAKTRLDLEIIKTKLDSQRVQLSRSRVLRAERDRLTAELQAWEYVRAHAAGVSVMHDLGEKFPQGLRVGSTATPERGSGAYCTLCKHAPHGAGKCIGNRGLCACAGDPQPITDRIGCDQCGHDHRQGARCGMLIETEARRMSCGCTS